MKKILLAISFFFFVPIFVSANEIYSIDLDIYLNEEGKASITETWDVYGTSGTEWYKVENGLTDKLSNFSVMMDGKSLVYKKWDIYETLEEKKGYYGINYTSSGIELCFGKYDLNQRHTFVLKYEISNDIIEVNDAQVLYWNLIDKLSDVNFEKFSVKIRSYYSFPDTLDVWGYGYRGYAYVKDGVIYMSNEESTNMNNLYAVALVKFPLNTFTSTYTNSKYSSFDDVYKAAENGSYEYDYDNDSSESIVSSIFNFLSRIFPFIVFALACVIANARNKKSGYGYRENKVIDKKNTNFFREIPCNKDIYYANTLARLNARTFRYNETNIFGAIILKWVKEDKVSFIKGTSKIFNKEIYSLDLTKKVEFENSFERELFSMMKEASKDGILESKEFEKWARLNYSEFFSHFTNEVNKEIRKLKEEGHITDRQNKKECKYGKVLDDKIYEDSVKLYGLKLYLEEFSKMDTKEVMEVKLWDEYLMFAYIFGIADKVAKQLKNLYPEFIENLDYDFNSIIIINNFSSGVYNAASAARSAAQSYSAGGGGFSSGGGGGGASGGGGGGSR